MRKTILSTENLLTALILSVYVDGLSLGLILRLSLSPRLAPNAGRFERVSVKNAGSEPLLSARAAAPSSSALNAPYRSCLPLQCCHGKDGVGDENWGVCGAPPSPVPLLIRGTLVMPHIGRAEPWRWSWRQGFQRRQRQHQHQRQRCQALPPLAVRPCVSVTVVVNVFALLP